MAAELARAASPFVSLAGEGTSIRLEKPPPLNLGVWWETEAPDREDVAVPESAVRKPACLRVPLFLPAPQTGALGVVGVRLTSNPSGEGRPGSLLGSLSAGGPVGGR